MAKMDQDTISAIVDAVAERILRDLPRGRLSIAPEYLSPDQVAQMTGFSLKWLEARRAERNGPPYIKVGHNVRYRAEDVRAFIEKGAVSA